MKSCDYCKKTILFGGTNAEPYTFCSTECHQRAYVLSIGNEIPEEDVCEAVHRIHGGRCPLCNGPGPVDIHFSYTIYSVVVMTSWRTDTHVCCNRCGHKKQVGALVASALVGWWGFPWGLLVTPVQVVRNITALGKSADPARPSPLLEQSVREQMAAAYLASQQQPAAQQEGCYIG